METVFGDLLMDPGDVIPDELIDRYLADAAVHDLGHAGYSWGKPPKTRN